MSAPDLALALVRTGVVLVAAHVAVLLARQRPELRVAAARWGLAGALLLALATPLLRERPRPLVPVSLSVSRMPILALASPSAPTRSEGAAESRAVPRAAVAPSEPFDPVASLPALWAAGSGLLFLQLGVGLLALRRMRRGCVPVADAALAARVATLAREAGVSALSAFEGASVAGPCVAGVVRPAICLPRDWASATHPDVVDAVLRHELAHVVNGDLRWGLFARFARALLWPQPLVWALRGPQAAAEEETCDRQVLAAGISQARYAAGLMALREARLKARVPSLAIGAASRRSGFGRRVEAILAYRGAGATRLSGRAGLAVGAGALALALGSAYAFARPTPTVA